MNESCPIWMSHVLYEWVMSRMNESCHIWMSLSLMLREECIINVFTSWLTHTCDLYVFDVICKHPVTDVYDVYVSYVHHIRIWFVLHSDDHFESHLPRNGLYLFTSWLPHICDVYVYMMLYAIYPITDVYGVYVYSVHHIRIHVDIHGVYVYCVHNRYT